MDVFSYENSRFFFLWEEIVKRSILSKKKRGEGDQLLVSHDNVW